jgi:hypothetical protein
MAANRTRIQVLVEKIYGADEVTALNAKFQKTWAKSDTKITTSCLCQAKK